MHLFFADPSQVTADEVRITGSDVNHIRNVLRLRAGDEIHVRMPACSVAELRVKI